MVWQIMNDIDCEKAYNVPLFVRSPFIESEGIMGDHSAFKAYLEVVAKQDPEQAERMQWTFDSMYNSISCAEKLASPRVIKSHLPLEMLPPKLLDTCKVIFVGRNPKDCCVSYFHHTNLIPSYNFKGDFDDFADLFLNDELEYGSYWDILKVNQLKN